MKGPLVEVVEHRRQDRSGGHTMGDGSVVFLCGYVVSVDTLACGHTVEVAGGGKAKRRRCPECHEAGHVQLALFVGYRAK